MWQNEDELSPELESGAVRIRASSCKRNEGQSPDLESTGLLLWSTRNFLSALLWSTGRIFDNIN